MRQIYARTVRRKLLDDVVKRNYQQWHDSDQRQQTKWFVVFITITFSITK